MFGTLSTKCGDFTIFLVARYGTCQWLNDLSACPHTFAVYPIDKSVLQLWVKSVIMYPISLASTRRASLTTHYLSFSKRAAWSNGRRSSDILRLIAVNVLLPFEGYSRVEPRVFGCALAICHLCSSLVISARQKRLISNWAMRSNSVPRICCFRAAWVAAPPRFRAAGLARKPTNSSMMFWYLFSDSDSRPLARSVLVVVMALLHFTPVFRHLLGRTVLCFAYPTFFTSILTDSHCRIVAQSVAEEAQI